MFALNAGPAADTELTADAGLAADGAGAANGRPPRPAALTTVARRLFRWIRARRIRRADAVIATVAAPLYVVGTQLASSAKVPPHRALDLPAYALLVLAGAALALRAVRPGTVFAVTLACGALMLVRHHAFGPVFLSPCLALATVVVRHGPRAGLGAAGAMGTALLLADVVGAGRDAEAAAAYWPAWYAAALLPFGVGAVIRAEREHRAAETRAQAERHLARAQEERLAVAREVHDVLGHTLSVITMRAGVALHVADRRPEQTIEALEAIREISRDALGDLKAALGVIRERPVPGVADVADLVESVGAAGPRVELVVTGDAGELPAATGHAVYRIVQEALTNVVRHARGTRATVRLGYDDEGVSVRVVDDGTAAPGRPGAGMAGMAERAAAVGGRLGHGPEPGEGFAVWAWLPARPPGPGDGAGPGHGPGPGPRTGRDSGSVDGSPASPSGSPAGSPGGEAGSPGGEGGGAP
ncbi:hypothetical protein GCM10010140_32600 [Streptosporangium pseudovulgare]|uniref:histidine kinase n=1 Tax=Streptosporangium pseudovulgare TaxID=35765 RepID=A0ABQ2QZI7_9ACTN|nr:hypothetical protein GCM10010140_32600 [Streptosporangium pseudovulgare]